MLRIQPEQLEHFANRSRDRFVRMMAEYIQSNFPDHARARPDLSAWVRQALSVCERYGVTLEPEAAQLTLILLVLGAGAPEREGWVHAAIAHDVAPVGKVRRLVFACRARGLPIDEVLVYGDMFRDAPEA